MIKPRGYLISLTTAQASAVLTCCVYFLDSRETQRGFEFFQKISSFPWRGLPDGRQATFAEELLATNFAAHANSDPIQSDEAVIETCLKKTFGGTAILKIRKL